MAQDPVAALVRHLAATSSITGLVTADHIYGDALPPTTATIEKAIAIRWVGGIREAYLPIVHPRLEVRCWGPTDAVAAQIWLEVYSVLNGLENVIIGDTRIMSVVMDGGPAALYDNERNAPYKLSFLSVMSQLEAVSL